MATKPSKNKIINTVDKNPTQHNTKYTAVWCKAELESILLQIMEDKKIITLQDVIRTKPYSHQRISEWVRDFPVSCSDAYKRIMDELANRLYVKGLYGKANPTMAIFGLKCNHGWRDNPRPDDDPTDKQIKPVKRLLDC